MVTIPGTNYCGPGNAMINPILSEVDKICFDHDKGYANYGGLAYVVWNVHDRTMIKELAKRHDWRSTVMKAAWSLKRTVAPDDRNYQMPKRDRPPYGLDESYKGRKVGPKMMNKFERRNRYHLRQIREDVEEKYGYMLNDEAVHAMADDQKLPNNDMGVDDEVWRGFRYWYQRRGSMHPGTGLRNKLPPGLHQRTLRSRSGLRRNQSDLK